MKRIIEKDLSYKITGFCFRAHQILGRFCREKQYGDTLEDLLKNGKTQYRREFEIKNFNELSPKGNKVDFLIEDKVILDIKAKRFITKDDYFQMQRYLKGADLELGLIVNFRSPHLKPKRIINNSYHSDANSGNSDRLDHSHRSSGYIVLITVLVIGAIGAAIATSVIWLGLGSSKSSLALEQSNQAKALANACSEEALQQIRDSTPYTGSGNLTLGQGTCSYTVTSGTGQNRTITATGTVGTILRKVTITIDAINPAINVTSWQEVADF